MLIPSAILICRYQIKEKCKQGMDKIKRQLRNIIQMHNGKCQQHMAASCTYQLLSSPSCSTRAIQKSLNFHEKYLSFPGREKKKIRRIDYQEKNDQTERARGLGRKTREEIGKRNQMTALRFQTRGERRRH